MVDFKGCLVSLKDTKGGLRDTDTACKFAVIVSFTETKLDKAEIFEELLQGRVEKLQTNSLAVRGQDRFNGQLLCGST